MQTQIHTHHMITVWDDRHKHTHTHWTGPFIWNCNHPHTYALINRLYTITTHGNIVVFHHIHQKNTWEREKKGFSNNLTGIKGNDKAKHIISRRFRLDVYTHTHSLSTRLSYSSENECAKGIKICMYTQNIILRTGFVYIEFVCEHDSSTQSWTEKKVVSSLTRKKMLGIRAKWNYPSKKRRTKMARKNSLVNHLIVVP